MSTVKIHIEDPLPPARHGPSTAPSKVDIERVWNMNIAADIVRPCGDPRDFGFSYDPADLAEVRRDRPAHPYSWWIWWITIVVGLLLFIRFVSQKMESDKKMP